MPLQCWREALRDDVYEWLEGTTDSEACFGLVLSLLDPEAIAANTLEPSELQNAMLGAIAMLREMLEQEGIETGYSTFNFALTDGQTVVAAFVFFLCACASHWSYAEQVTGTSQHSSAVQVAPAQVV